MENKRKFIFILVLILVVILTAGTVFTIKIIKDVNASGQQPMNDSNPIIDAPPVSKPTLSVLASIEIDKFETYTYTYTVTDLGDYAVSVEILDNTIANIDNDLKITPIKVGETQIRVSINCEPKIEKTTTLIIKDAVSDYDYGIVNESGIKCDYLYVNNYYILQITENAIVDEIPKLGYDDDFVANVSLISKEKNILKYKFKVINYGNFVFKYESKYCKRDTEVLTAYEYPNNFSVTFTNNVLNDNNINLYLFNENYISDANSDGYYNNSNFDINTKPNTNDKINVSMVGDCATICDNKICALKVGMGKLLFKSEISGIEKEYTINVQIIEPTAIIFNNQEKLLGETIKLNLQQNIPYGFKLNIEPSYAYGAISYNTSSGVSLADDKITLNAKDTQIVNVLFNDVTVLVINISKVSSYEIVKSIFYSTTDNYILSDDCLTITYEADCEIFIRLALKNSDDNTTISNCVFGFTIGDETIVTKTNEIDESINGLIKLYILKQGVTTLYVFNQKYNISITLNIVVR